MHTRLITENLLDSWVRGNARVAQGLIVELIARLVSAASPSPNDRRFPLGDSINQTGEDGYLDANLEYKPFVPRGKSYWEIGTGENIQPKATKDYRELTNAISPAERKDATFIFVTPLSGRRGWEAKPQKEWIRRRKKQNDWQDVKVIDGTRLSDWLGHFPAVEGWLASKIGQHLVDLQPVELRWAELKTIGSPPPLPSAIFLTKREAAVEKLGKIFSKESISLKLLTHYMDQVANFVAAYVSSIDTEKVPETVGRSLIVPNANSWREAADLMTPHILIADFDIEDTSEEGTRLLEIARQKGHAVVFRGIVGGVPDPNSVALPNPTIQHLEQALKEGGYTDIRARLFANKSDGNLNILLRLLQNLSPTHDWASGSIGSESAIAQFIGSWNEEKDEDRAIVEEMSGKAYGEWISKIRIAANLPGTPLTHREKVWKFTGRYEAWIALGAYIYDNHLKTFKEVAVKVLSESDPKFELPPDQHYMASVYGKELRHSKQIRKGIATSLALLGSYPEALSRCSKYFPERISYDVVYGILGQAEGTLWASLSDLLPQLAEASPEAFLKSVEQALLTTPSPFNDVFAQEGDAIGGWNYITGLLWALESLAWNAEYLIRVISILGDLAVVDPGGTWANRPKNSMWTILLPWMPQTCATVEQRQAAVRTLLTEQPPAGWQLLIDLIDASFKVTSGSFKPTWRSWIPEDWEDKVTRPEYIKQVIAYEQVAIDEAPGSTDRIIDIFNLLDKFSPEAIKRVLSILKSQAVMELSDEKRLGIWTKLMAIVSKHRKYADANWAMETKLVDEIAMIAETLSPTSLALLHLRLFTHSDLGLFEERDNIKQQEVDLSRKRIKAVEEIFTESGLEGLLNFARSVESSWKLGRALGASSINVEEFILPSLLDSEDKALQNFAGSFLEVRVHERGWEWFDSLNITGWSPAQIGQILAFLPFTDETWLRVENLLKEQEGEYWTRAYVNPYRHEGSFEHAIDLLIKYGRPCEAVDCLHAMLSDKKVINAEQAIAALNGVLRTSVEGRPHSMDGYHIQRIIKVLQEDTGVSIEEMIKIEWGFLHLLEHEDDVFPKTIETDLATNPNSFCEVVRIMYKSKKEKKQEEPTKERKLLAEHGWHLLNGWRIPPGTQQDGTFDGNSFDEWLKTVKESCKESGHLEAALIHIGQVLIRAPSDPSGLWIHASIAKDLNAKDAEDMRDGYRTALYNSRGAHWVDPEGKPEMKLAADCKDKADALEAAGYHRLATTLKQLGNSYEREAEWIREREPFDD